MTRTHIVKEHYRTYHGEKKLIKSFEMRNPVRGHTKKQPPRIVKRKSLGKRHPEKTKQVKGVPYKEVWISADDLKKGTTVRINFKNQTVTLL